MLTIDNDNNFFQSLHLEFNIHDSRLENEFKERTLNEVNEYLIRASKSKSDDNVICMRVRDGEAKTTYLKESNDKDLDFLERFFLMGVHRKGYDLFKNKGLENIRSVLDLIEEKPEYRFYVLLKYISYLDLPVKQYKDKSLEELCEVLKETLKITQKSERVIPEKMLDLINHLKIVLKLEQVKLGLKELVPHFRGDPRKVSIHDFPQYAPTWFRKPFGESEKKIEKEIVVEEKSLKLIYGEEQPLLLFSRKKQSKDTTEKNEPTCGNCLIL